MQSEFPFHHGNAAKRVTHVACDLRIARFSALPLSPNPLCSGRDRTRKGLLPFPPPSLPINDVLHKGAARQTAASDTIQNQPVCVCARIGRCRYVGPCSAF